MIASCFQAWKWYVLRSRRALFFSTCNFVLSLSWLLVQRNKVDNNMKDSRINVRNNTMSFCFLSFHTAVVFATFTRWGRKFIRASHQQRVYEVCALSLVVCMVMLLMNTHAFQSGCQMSIYMLLPFIGVLSLHHMGFNKNVAIFFFGTMIIQCALLIVHVVSIFGF